MNIAGNVKNKMNRKLSFGWSLALNKPPGTNTQITIVGKGQKSITGKNTRYKQLCQW